MDNDLRRLNRTELLEVLVRLSEENESLANEVASLREQLAARDLAIAESGSIAEAALRVNGFFQAAEDAVSQYAENMKRRIDEAYREAERVLAEAREQAGLPPVEASEPELADSAANDGGDASEDAREGALEHAGAGDVAADSKGDDASEAAEAAEAADADNVADAVAAATADDAANQANEKDE